MQLKSLEKILQGVGQLRAASVVAWAANNAAFLGLHLSAGVQREGVIGGTILLAVVNIADGYIRGQHASALPALIAQGAESVAKVQDPRVTDVANSVDTLAKRIDAVESRSPAPTLPEIIAALTGKDAATQASTPAPASPVPPVNPGLTA